MYVTMISRIRYEQEVMDLLVLCCAVVSATRLPEVRHIDLAVTNHLEAEIDVVAEQSPSMLLAPQRSGLSMLSWPLLRFSHSRLKKQRLYRLRRRLKD